MTAFEFAKPNLFKPLNITEVRWDKDQDGYTSTAWGLHTAVRDYAKFGFLFLNKGRWEDKQLIPEAWLREAVQTAPDIRANCPKEQWKYGYAFWTNDHGQLWPNLPRDAFAASGAGHQHIWVCPSLDLLFCQA